MVTDSIQFQLCLVCGADDRQYLAWGSSGVLAVGPSSLADQWCTATAAGPPSAAWALSGQHRTDIVTPTAGHFVEFTATDTVS